MRYFLMSLMMVVAAGALAQSPGSGLGAWQNPDIGFVYDLKFDMHNAEVDENGDKVWKTRGFELPVAELSVGSELDPYSRIDFNAQFMKDGAEIHELFLTAHSLPLSLKLRGGQFLGSFGRWSQFHSHSMPFASEPRILHEYLDGHFMSTGLELSWLAPTDHYIEFFGGAFNGIEGHSHDTDPASSEAEYGPDNPPPGCHYHGDTLHCPGDEELEAYYNSLLTDSEAPIASSGNLGPADLAWLGRVQTNLELGLDWSVDLGASLVYQKNYRNSLRFEGTTYAKTVGGIDMTVFWNPVESNLFKGADFGVEYIQNRQDFEVLVDEDYLKRNYVRDGFFTWGRYRINRTWDFGATYESFDEASGVENRRTRVGGFLTWSVSHYQKVRLEYVRDDRGEYADSVDQIVLQFDGVIGFHTHGRQR